MRYRNAVWKKIRKTIIRKAKTIDVQFHVDLIKKRPKGDARINTETIQTRQGYRRKRKTRSH